ncbi:MAG: hypothetical protein ACRC6V_04765 [Bacteroidales bacterium]
MKKVTYRLSIVFIMLAVSSTQIMAQYSNEEYSPFSRNTPYYMDDEDLGFGDAISGPGVEKTPIEDGYLALLLLSIPYAISIYKKRDKSI